MPTKDPAIAILANLGKRVRRARRSLRQLKKLPGVSEEQVDHARTIENEAWNAFQASKAVYNAVRWGEGS